MSSVQGTSFEAAWAAISRACGLVMEHLWLEHVMNAVVILPPFFISDCTVSSMHSTRKDLRGLRASEKLQWLHGLRLLRATPPEN